MKKVAILGVGPAGLIAAQAAALSGAFVSLFSAGGPDGPTKSRLGGAQFLHMPVPDINDAANPNGIITYHLAGSPQSYQTKVYGDGDVPFVSMSNIRDLQKVAAWSLIDTYEELWNRLVFSDVALQNPVNIVNITPQWLHELLESGVYDLVVSTIPKNKLCLAHAGLIDGPQHAFSYSTIRIMNRCVFDTIEGDRVLYDGTTNVSWYRTSKIFGVGSTEWGASAPDKLPYKDDIVVVRKPVATDCRCWDGHVMHVGRYGTWRKGVLAHEGFKEVWDALH